MKPTPTDPIDFKSFAQELNSRAEFLLFQWLPSGKLIGREYVCGSIDGEPGDSFRFNVDKCVGKDFATGETVSDVLDLYCKINGIKPLEAYQQLSTTIQLNYSPQVKLNTKPAGTIDHDIVDPPPNHEFTGQHYTHGLPTHTYTYTNADGAILFYVCRYETSSGKQFSPWSWSDSKQKFVAKSWPYQRPLWNLHAIHYDQDKRIIVVEGEKSANALAQWVPDLYVVTTWSGGANAYNKTDITPLKNRHVILWPDADEPGRRAMAEIAAKLLGNTESLKIIDTSDLPTGLDAADLPPDTKFYDWARPRVSEIKHPVPETTIINQNLHVHPPAPSDEPEPTRNMYALWMDAGILPNGKKKPDCNVSTVAKILWFDPFFKQNLWFDTFTKKIMTPDGQISDADEINIQIMLQEKYGLSQVPKTTVQDAITSFTAGNTKNMLTDWLDTLKHDGVFRLDDFLTVAMGVHKSNYTQAVSRNFWLSLIARAYKPGCKVDEMMVLEGSQGTYKSTALEIIGGKYYGKVSANLDSKDFMQSLQGRWLMEMDELDRMSKAADTTIKQILSTATDLYRASYGRHTLEYPRTCIFAGTTNEFNYLRDATGSRRFWPIRVKECDMDYIRSNRDQLLAEAVLRFKAGENWHEVPWDEAQLERADRQIIDEWEFDIVHYTRGREFVLVKDLCEQVFNMNTRDIGTLTTNRVSNILRRMNWEPRRVYLDDDRVRVWVPKDSAVKAFKRPVKTPNIFQQNL